VLDSGYVDVLDDHSQPRKNGPFKGAIFFNRRRDDDVSSL
jgi:hypothetical protein